MLPPSNVRWMRRGEKALSFAPFSFAAEGSVPWNFWNARVKLSGES